MMYSVASTMNLSSIAQTGDWCHMLSLSMCLVAFGGNYSTLIYPISPCEPVEGTVVPLLLWPRFFVLFFALLMCSDRVVHS